MLFFMQSGTSDLGKCYAVFTLVESEIFGAPFFEATVYNF